MDRADVATCLAVLARLDDADLDEVTRREVERAVVDAARRVKKRAKARRDLRARQADRALLAGATRFHTEIPSTTADDPGGAADGTGGAALIRARRCYVCKTPYRSVDMDYHLMCPPCATENRARRHARCDLTGRTAVVTGVS
ncbi:hypothetical protein V6U90_31270 [Micromonospora sp. CPCC 206060]|uniref:hypothetical protein n=1 Tax=Micromonospora sp. CPCC 206060 TaxID=3122406 RepID=UPI002FF3B5FB